MRECGDMIVQLAGDLAFLSFDFDTGPTRCAPIEEWQLRAWWIDCQRSAPSSPRDWWAQWLPRHMAGDPAPHGDFWAIRMPGSTDPIIARLIPAAQCGCCGERNSIMLVASADDPAEREWRCEKHMGRSPCFAPGCGRTFAAIDPRQSFVCGRHWRSGPKRMREQIRAIDRRLKRFERVGARPPPRNEVKRLRWLRRQAWRRLEAAIIEGPRIDLAEIERQFGI